MNLLDYLQNKTGMNKRLSPSSLHIMRETGTALIYQRVTISLYRLIKKNKEIKKRIFLLMLFTSLAVWANGQAVRLTGKVVDEKQKTMPGVGIKVTNSKDTTEKHLTASDNNGNFSVSGLRPNSSYVVRATFIGFGDVVRQVNTLNNTLNIEVLVMQPKAQLLDEVIVEGQRTPVVQKGDTTEMSAAAYKVNPDANAQELVQKMPGITVENGTVKAQGEEIRRVLVDGKNFFGEDASMALQNLPAEVVDKVQVYNKMSDQSEFTGFDDGNTSRVLNIVTRADRRKGENGTITAGYDFDDKYLVTGRLNVFRGNRRLTITGGTNNINQQNFSSQDLLGTSGGGGRGSRRGGGGGGYSGGSTFIGRQSGLNKPSSLGINYSDYIGTKINLSGSYFFNNQDNFTLRNSDIENIGRITDSIVRPKYQKQYSNSNTENYNHRFDFRMEYTLDSANSIIFAPRFSTQLNNISTESTDARSNIYNLISDTTYYITGNSSTEGFGYNYSGDLTFRHKFETKGRTVSLGLNASGNQQESDGIQYSLTQRLVPSVNPNERLFTNDTVDLYSNSDTKGYTLSGNLAYTEPLGANGILQFAYNASFSRNSTNKESRDQETDQIVQRYSNIFENKYDTHRGGLSYRFRSGDKIMAGLGVDYQYADLTGDRVSPSVAKVKKSFENVLPNAMMNIKFSTRSNLRLFYRSSTNPPSVNQLQDVVTVSNSLNYSQGNPDLKHEYTNNGMLNYRYSNSEKFTNFGFNLFGNFTQNTISNAVYYVSNDSIIDIVTKPGTPNDTIRVPRGGQLTKPVNFKGSWNTRLFFNYGFLFKPIKCNFNFIGGLGYSKSPGAINNISTTTNQYNITGGLVVASNISQSVDFTMSYTGNYNISDVIYGGDVSKYKSKLGNTFRETWNHSISLTSNFIMWNTLTFQNTISQQLNYGLGSGYNQNYLLWNASFGVKVFKNKSGQFRFTVYDMLNKNQNVSQSVSSTSITNSTTNLLQRFYLFSFTYTLRNYQSGGDGERRREGGFGGRGMGVERYGRDR